MIAHGNSIEILAGNSNKALADAIAAELKTVVSDAEIGKFSDGEINVTLPKTVRGKDVFIVQSTSAPVNDNLMELLIMIDACKRASAGRITAVMPYFGYARQDRKARPRDPITAKLVADMLTSAGADRVLTIDLHAAQIQGFFNIPVDHLYTRYTHADTGTDLTFKVLPSAVDITAPYQCSVALTACPGTAHQVNGILLSLCHHSVIEKA